MLCPEPTAFVRNGYHRAAIKHRPSVIHMPPLDNHHHRAAVFQMIVTQIVRDNLSAVWRHGKFGPDNKGTFLVPRSLQLVENDQILPATPHAYCDNPIPFGLYILLQFELGENGDPSL